MQKRWSAKSRSARLILGSTPNHGAANLPAGAKMDIVNLARRLLAQDCLLCAAASGEKPLCPHCIKHLPALGECCPVCALPSPGAQVCGRCLAHPMHFDRTLAAWAYEYPVDRIVQAFKFNHRLELAQWFAESLVPYLDLPPPLLVAMPLHKSRLAERGFNQALEIARQVAGFTGGRLLLSAVHKHRETLYQSELPLSARAKNVRGAFRCTQAFDNDVVVVVDDVMTTGATLNELARVLKRAGAGRVVNLVVARTLPTGERRSPEPRGMPQSPGTD